MIRNCFVMEDLREKRLILGAGVRGEWLAGGDPVSLGPTMTAWGAVSVSIGVEGGGVDVHWNGDWHGDAPRVEIRLPGTPAIVSEGGRGHARAEPSVAR
jgi:hypothetical protein